MTPGEHTLLNCASHLRVSACMGPWSLLHKNVSFGQTEMCLILLLPLLEQCLVFDMFMLCFFCSTSGQDNSIVMMHLQQVGTHSILQSC